MTSVWLVTTGSYSDYSVDLVFTSKELASAYIAQRQTLLTRTDYNDAKEFPLLDHLPEPPEILYRAEVWINPDGSIFSQSVIAQERMEWQSANLDVEDKTLHIGRRYIRVTGPDRDEVLTTFKEHVAESLATPPQPRLDQMMTTLRELDESEATKNAPSQPNS